MISISKKNDLGLEIISKDSEHAQILRNVTSKVEKIAYLIQEGK